MTDAIEVRVKHLERNSEELWRKHDECEKDRHNQELALKEMQRNHDLLKQNVDTISQNTTEIKAIVQVISDDSKGAKGFALGVKELVLFAAALAAVVGFMWGGQ